MRPAPLRVFVAAASPTRVGDSTCRPLPLLSAPRYPTKLEALGDPSLLEKALPARWRRSEALGALAAFAVLGQTACAPGCRAPAPARPVVAPVAEHGEGVASVGCIVVSPPVFFSEEEAFKIIRDEAAKRGLALARNNSPLFGTGLEVRRPPLADKPTAFAPDLVEAGRPVAVEFVSREDADDHGEADGMRGWSAWSIKTGRAARELASLVQKNGAKGHYLGVLYDPAGHPEFDEGPDSWEVRRLKKFASNEEMLRLQVRDFLDWLEAQGAL